MLIGKGNWKKVKWIVHVVATTSWCYLPRTWTAAFFCVCSQDDVSFHPSSSAWWCPGHPDPKPDLAHQADSVSQCLGPGGGSGVGLWQGGCGWWVLNLFWSHQPNAGGAQGGSVRAELWPFSKPPLNLPSVYDSASGIRILALKLDFTGYCVIWAIYSTSSGLSFYICNEVCHNSYPPTYRSMTFLCLSFLSGKYC